MNQLSVHASWGTAKLSYSSEQKWNLSTEGITNGFLLHFVVTDKSNDVWKGFMDESMLDKMSNKKLQTFLTACPDEIVNNFTNENVMFNGVLQIRIAFINTVLEIPLVKEKEDARDREIRLLKQRITDLESEIYTYKDILKSDEKESRIYNVQCDVNAAVESIKSLAIGPGVIAISRENFDNQFPVADLIEFVFENDAEFKLWAVQKHNTTRSVIFDEYYDSDEKLLQLRLRYAAEFRNWELLRAICTGTGGIPQMSFMFFRQIEHVCNVKWIHVTRLQNQNCIDAETKELEVEILQIESGYALVRGCPG